MDYYLFIIDNQIKKIYNASYEVREGFIGKSMKDGKFKVYESVENTEKVSFPDDRQHVANSKSNYKLDDNGAWRLKTDDELWEDGGKQSAHQKLKNLRDEDMSKTTVLIDGNEIWADPASEQNFSGRIREMELNGRNETKWIQGDDIFILTLEQLKQVVAEGTVKNAAIWDHYIDEVEKL